MNDAKKEVPKKDNQYFTFAHFELLWRQYDFGECAKSQLFAAKMAGFNPKKRLSIYAFYAAGLPMLWVFRTSVPLKCRFLATSTK